MLRVDVVVVYCSRCRGELLWGVSKCQAARDAENRRATLSAIFAHTRIASQIQPRTPQRPSISTTLDNQLTSKIPPSCQAKPDTVRLHLQRIPNLHESATSPGPRRNILCHGKSVEKPGRTSATRERARRIGRYRNAGINANISFFRTLCQVCTHTIRSESLIRKEEEGAANGGIGIIATTQTIRRPNIRLEILTYSSRGRHLSYQRGKRTTTPGTSLIKIEGVENTEGANFYLGKKVAFVYRAGKEIRGSKIRVIWGKITRPHGTCSKSRIRQA